MNWLDFLASSSTLIAVLLVLFGSVAVLAAIGYHRAAAACAMVIALSTAAGFAAGFGGAVSGLSFAGRGEGAGVAALLFGFAAGCATSAAVIATGCLWLYRRRQHYFVQRSRSALLGAAGFMMIAAAITLTALRFPQFRSIETLARISSTGFDIGIDGSAMDELRSRGTEAVPAIIDSLRTASSDNLREFENGLNAGAMQQLALLGELGGPQAIEELRKWFQNESYAADVRSAAGRALGDAGDSESAPAIGVLLEKRDYEWRKCHFDLILALRWLDAEAEVSHIVSALNFTSDEEGSSFQIGLIDAGIGALLTIDSPESIEAVETMLREAPLERRARVQYAIDMFETSGGDQASPR